MTDNPECFSIYDGTSTHCIVCEVRKECIKSNDARIKRMESPSSTIDTLPTCPFCSFVQSDYYDLKDGSVFECPKCLKKSTVEISTQFILNPEEE